MSTKAELQALLDRVKAATARSDLLDAEIYATVGGTPHTTKAGKRTIPLILKGDPREFPAYTGSIDAITALIERELPAALWTVPRPVGWKGRKMKTPPRNAIPYDAFLATDDRIGERQHKFALEEGASPALALTAAFLSVLIAQMESSHAE